MTTNRAFKRTYHELVQLKTFKERFEYLRLDGVVGKDTFGFDRYINQKFYHSKEWESLRDFVIVRDNSCDLAMEGYDIFRHVYIHHINPITAKDIELRSEHLLDPEFLVCVTHETHNAIHYGDEKLLVCVPPVRRPNDTCPWRH